MTAPRGLKGLALEGVVIVVSVFVALLAEDWRAEREERESVSRALEAVEAEIAADAVELETFIEVVAGRHDRLMAMEPVLDDSVPFSAQVGGFGGYRLPDLDRSAWNRVRSDPLANRVAPERIREAFAHRISEAILSQQLSVARTAVEHHHRFLDGRGARRASSRADPR